MNELDKMNICALAVLTLNAIQTAVNAKSVKAEELARAAEKAEILARMLRKLSAAEQSGKTGSCANGENSFDDRHR